MAVAVAAGVVADAVVLDRSRVVARVAVAVAAPQDAVALAQVRADLCPFRRLLKNLPLQTRRQVFLRLLSDCTQQERVPQALDGFRIFLWNIGGEGVNRLF